MESKRWAGLVSLGLMAAGAGVSWYLYSRGLKLTATGLAGQDVCSAVFDRSCDETLLSDFGSFLGMSVAGWGIVYFAVLAFLLLLGASLRRSLWREANTALIAVNLVGLVVSAVLVWLIASGRAPVCPMCFVTHTINLAILPFLFLYYGQPVKTIVADMKTGLAVAFGPQGATGEGTGLKVASLLTAGLVGLLVYQALLLRSHTVLGDTGGVVAADVIREHFAKEVEAVAIDEDDPVKGPANAPIVVVEFADFQCPTCRRVSSLVRRIENEFSGTAQFVFKHYPLGKECNPYVPEEVHRYACTFAKLAIAAQLQDIFWPFHDRLMGLSRTPTEEMLRDMAREVGLDPERLFEDAESERVAEILAEDIEAANAVRVYGTPAFFVNGRRLTHEHLPQLSLILSAELEME